MTEFVPFPKIGRLKRGMIITEKLDGTNAQIYIRRADGPVVTDFEVGFDVQIEHEGSTFYIRAGSRNRWLNSLLGVDNYGFGHWVYQNAPELVKLGEGRHFGEWWGQGIQRGYGLKEKRFSLFNTGRWTNGIEEPPACCHVVPVLYQGDFEMWPTETVMLSLKNYGSVAAPGFMNPEGIIVFHSATRTLFKQTFEHDATGKEAA